VFVRWPLIANASPAATVGGAVKLYCKPSRSCEVVGPTGTWTGQNPKQPPVWSEMPTATRSVRVCGARACANTWALTIAEPPAGIDGITHE